MADVKSVFKTIFPYISAASSLGGPLATMAANAVGKALGVDGVAPSAESIQQAIAGATPEQMLALKKAEQDFQLQLKELDIKSVADLEKIAADDRNSARNREIALKDRIPALLSLLVTIGFFGLLGYMLKYQIPSNNRDILNVMLGSLGTAWIAIITYYFGSSAGSARKSELLAQAPPK